MEKIGYFIHPRTRQRYETLIKKDAVVAGLPIGGVVEFDHNDKPDAFGFIGSKNQPKIKVVSFYINGIDSTNSDLFLNKKADWSLGKVCNFDVFPNDFENFKENVLDKNVKVWNFRDVKTGESNSLSGEWISKESDDPYGDIDFGG